MKVLVTGGQGMLGQDLVSVLSKKQEVFAPKMSELDLTDRGMIKNCLEAFSPDVVVNCAAYVQVDQAEEEVEQAYSVNAFGAQNIALASAKQGCALCHVSTDYVFDGSKKMFTPFDQTAPLNVYGMSKLAGEWYVRWALNRFYIVRTSWLYGRHGNNFVDAILKKAASEGDLKVVHDQVGAPTWTVSLAAALTKLIETEAYGIYHYTDDSGEGVSWYDFAIEILRQAGIDRNVLPIATSEFPRPATRPQRSTLDCSLIKMLGIEKEDWKTSLELYLKP